MKKFYRYGVMFIFLICNMAIAVSPTFTAYTFNPLPESQIIFNPGIGLSDFHHEVSYPYDTNKRKTSKTAYYRFYWSWLEPTQGAYDFSAIDQ